MITMKNAQNNKIKMVSDKPAKHLWKAINNNLLNKLRNVTLHSMCNGKNKG